MIRHCAVALTVGIVIIIAWSASALISSSAGARGYVGPAPTSSHSLPTFSQRDLDRVEHVQRKQYRIAPNAAHTRL
jgi:hypothetical protein